VVKEIKVRRKRKRGWKKTIAILLFVIVMGTIITLSALRQSPQSPPVPKPADEYFEFSDATAVAESQDPENKSILISQVGFKITAIEGNATDVIITPEGYIIGDPPYFDILIQGAPTQVGPIQYVYGVLKPKEDEKGYPLRLYIESPQAVGYVTIYVTKFYSFPS